MKVVLENAGDFHIQGINPEVIGAVNLSQNHVNTNGLVQITKRIVGSGVLNATQ